MIMIDLPEVISRLTWKEFSPCNSSRKLAISFFPFTYEDDKKTLLSIYIYISFLDLMCMILITTAMMLIGSAVKSTSFHSLL